MPIPFFSKLRRHKHYYDHVRPDIRKVEELIESQTECFDPTVADYMETVCRSRGKLLRPVLVLLVGGATGGVKDEHIRLGAILEMVHLASLVHDDVIDRADTRRNDPTANALWGNNLAVLLGDVLFAHAMILGTGFGSVDFCTRLGTMVRDVCQGEVEQSSRMYDLSMTKEEYFATIQKKTASLFAAATSGAAWLSGANQETQDAMHRFGILLGTAYQIYDDCLDMVGDEDDA
ncbi:MAG: polyprenyl synthetase family protein, partial [Akkermansia sp.]